MVPLSNLPVLKPSPLTTDQEFGTGWESASNDFHATSTSTYLQDGDYSVYGGGGIVLQNK
jgi:hypothetical protein